MKNIPLFLNKNENGYSHSKSNNFEKTCFDFVLYYDDINYDIMRCEGQKIKVIPRTLSKEFSTEEETENYINVTKSLGYNLIRENSLKVSYYEMATQKVELPIYILNKYGFAVYSFKTGTFDVPISEDLKIAKEICNAVNEAIKISDYITVVQNTLNSFNDCRCVFFDAGEDSEGYYKYLPSTYLVIHSLYTTRGSYIIFDKENVRKNTIKDGCVIKVQNEKEYEFLLTHDRMIKSCLGISEMIIENIN